MLIYLYVQRKRISFVVAVVVVVCPFSSFYFIVLHDVVYASLTEYGVHVFVAGRCERCVDIES